MKITIKPGITTLELDKIAEDYIRSNNAIPAFKGYSQAGSFDFPGSICADMYVEHSWINFPFASNSSSSTLTLDQILSSLFDTTPVTSIPSLSFRLTSSEMTSVLLDGL